MFDEVKSEASVLEALTSMVERAEKLKLLLTLIERATSIAVVRDFLKARNLQHSAASWDELRSKRLVPAFEEGRLSLADLHGLLRRTEGFGRQHVFLFQCPPERACAMIAESRVRDLLKEKGFVGVGQEPLIVDMPDVPLIVDASFSGVDPNRVVTLKEIEKRIARKLKSEQTDKVSMTYTKVYQVEEQRAVNVARLWSNGLLEIRIASRDNATRYKEDLASFLGRLWPVILVSEFQEISLKKVKDDLWARRIELNDLVRFSTYTLENDEGFSLRANAALSTDDLADNEQIAKSLAEFRSEQTYCSASNIFFKKPNADGSEKEIHVLLNGEVNEFAVTAAITEEEYEYVLHQVRKYN